MAKQSSEEIKANLAKMIESGKTGDVTGAKAILDALPKHTITIELAPLPMLNGRYGWIGSTTVNVGGKDVPVQATVTHPDSKAGETDLNLGFAYLADERRKGMQANNAPVSAKAAMDKMSPEAQQELLKERIAAMSPEDRIAFLQELVIGAKADEKTKAK